MTTDNNFIRFYSTVIICNEELYIRNTSLSGYGDEMMEDIKRMSRKPWFREQSSSWMSRFNAPFMEIISDSGMEFSFNILPFDQIFRADM